MQSQHDHHHDNTNQYNHVNAQNSNQNHVKDPNPKHDRHLVHNHQLHSQAHIDNHKLLPLPHDPWRRLVWQVRYHRAVKAQIVSSEQRICPCHCHRETLSTQDNTPIEKRMLKMAKRAWRKIRKRTQQETERVTVMTNTQRSMQTHKASTDEQVPMDQLKTLAKIHIILNEPRRNALATIVSGGIVATIVIAVGEVIIQSLPNFMVDNVENSVAQQTFSDIEDYCEAMFTMEYALRLMAVVPYRRAVEQYRANTTRPIPTEKAINLIWRHVTSIFSVIDLIAILPFYISFAVTGDRYLIIFRVLRLLRIFRIFKLGRYSAAMQLFVRVLIKSKDALLLLIFYITIAMVLFGSLIYFTESGTYDPSTNEYMRPTVDGIGEEPTPFTSIPLSFYWVITTMTTVGYGDLTPTTAGGRAIASFVEIIGIITLALPIGIISMHYGDEYQLEQKRIAASMASDSAHVPPASETPNDKAVVDATQNNAINKLSTCDISSFHLLERQNFDVNAKKSPDADGKNSGFDGQTELTPGEQHELEILRTYVAGVAASLNALQERRRQNFYQ